MEHKPVLLPEVVGVLAPKEGEVFADLTAGYGGHAKALLKSVGKNGGAYLFDQDQMAVNELTKMFALTPNVQIKKQNFADIDWKALPQLDMVVIDLGVSSPQLDRADRGFSIRYDGPLDMRMDQSGDLTAAEIVNRYNEREIADILYNFGEEYKSRRVAAAIVAARQKQAITTTTQLADIVASVVPKKGKIHPATKTFQALRIAVNDELRVLGDVLPQIATKLKKGGRLAVISFHSLEDRIVKQFIRDITSPQINSYGAIVSQAKFQKVTKKAIKGDEFDSNPRARSARLRAAVKQI